MRCEAGAGRAFGTVSQSSRVLIRDARAEGEWAAAKLHMHAEDEFSAGSYGSAKRDAVRLLRGTFPVRIVVEGATPEAVWRAVRTSSGPRFVLIEELESETHGAMLARVIHTPARLHGFQRFSSQNTGRGNVILREWHVGNEILGFTITKEQR